MIAWKRIASFFSQQPRACKYLLPLSWLGGMLLGFYFALLSRQTLTIAVSNVVFSQTTAFSIFAASFLPFFLCTLSYHIEQRWLIIFVCFIKAASFAYCAVAVSFLYGNAAWLVRMMFMFTDCCTIPVLYYYCLMLGCPNDCKVRRTIWAVNIFAITIPLIDYCLISPFFLTVLSR